MQPQSLLYSEGDAEPGFRDDGTRDPASTTIMVVTRFMGRKKVWVYVPEDL